MFEILSFTIIHHSNTLFYFLIILYKITQCKILPLNHNFKFISLNQQQQQQANQKLTTEQVYQLFNKSELDSRQMFELIYNAYLKSTQELVNEKAKNAQLIEQLNQFTKQKDISGPKIIKSKNKK
jgi:hypothetical protein